MLSTPAELAAALGARIRERRRSMRLTQAQAAARSGVSYATWRRMETAGRASIDDLARAAIILRCEHELAQLFAPQAATSIDELIAGQGASPAARRRRDGKAEPA